MFIISSHMLVSAGSKWMVSHSFCWTLQDKIRHFGAKNHIFSVVAKNKFYRFRFLLKHSTQAGGANEAKARREAMPGDIYMIPCPGLSNAPAPRMIANHPFGELYYTAYRSIWTHQPKKTNQACREIWSE